jgi:hypothetical protein
MNEKISKWIEYISIKRPEINGFPICPFANKAKYEVITSTFIRGLKTGVELIRNTDTQIVIVDIEEHYTKEGLSLLCNHYNNIFRSMNDDLICLYDHPDDNNEINGIRTNSEMTLLLIQRLSDLNEANKILKNTKYYDTWSKEYYEKIVGSRNV